jgi:CheY-like chemotaxis protein
MTDSLTVPVIDDEPQIRRLIRNALEEEPSPLGPSAETQDTCTRVIDAETGRKGIDLAAAEVGAVVFLDLALPDISGMEVCQEIRSWFSAAIVVPSARNTDYGRLINAFDSLIGMPVSTVRHLGRDEGGRALLATTFEDSVDVRTGYDGCRGAAHHGDFCLRLFAGGYQMLTRVPPLLLNGRPNAASLQSARFAVEIYLKALLAARDRLTESSVEECL